MRLKPTEDRLAEHVIFPFQCKSKAFFSYFLSFYSVLFFWKELHKMYTLFCFFPTLICTLQCTAHHPTPCTLLLVDKQGVQHALLLHPWLRLYLQEPDKLARLNIRARARQYLPGNATEQGTAGFYGSVVTLYNASVALCDFEMFRKKRGVQRRQ